MKNAFQFRTHLVMTGEILPCSTNFLPGIPAKTGVRGGLFLPELNHLPVFGGVFQFHTENMTMAQPLLKGELR